MVILSCLTKKNQNLNARKKSSVYYWKLRFQGRNACKLPFLEINWTFFLAIKFWFRNDHNRLLYKFEKDKKNFGCVGSCGYAPASVKYLLWLQNILLYKLVHCISCKKIIVGSNDFLAWKLINVNFLIMKSLSENKMG